MRLDDGAEPNRTASEVPWWRQTGDIHTYWFTHALNTIDHDGRRDRLRRFRRVYRGESQAALADTELNVVKNGVLSIYAKVCRSQPTTEMLTEDGSVSLQERGRVLTSWVSGQRVDLETDRLTKMGLLDAEIYGTGGVQNFRDPVDGLCQESVWCGDCGVEQREVDNRHMRTLYRLRVMDRRVAQAKWPKCKHDLETAEYSLSDKDVALGTTNSTDMITVVEMWHIGESGVVGRHAIVASNCTLKNKEWKEKRWPIEFYMWDPDPEGYWGIGMVESMERAQELVDMVSDKTATSFEKGGPKRFIPSEAHVAPEQITDTPYENIVYDGQVPPILDTPPAISSDYRVHQQEQIDRLYQLNGISQFGASSLKPAGVESGAAMRSLNDVEDQYWFPRSSEFEDFCVRVDRGMVRVAEEIADSDEGDATKLEVLGINSAGGRATLKRIAYKDARFDADVMILRALPTAKLPSSMSGKLSDVSEMMQLELLDDKETALELLGFPDTKRWESLESAGRRLVQLQVERTMRGEPQVVDPSAIPLEFALKHSTQQLALARLNESDADLDVLQDYIDGVQSEIEALKEAAQAAAQAAAAPPPGPAPGGPPALAPVPPAPVALPGA